MLLADKVNLPKFTPVKNGSLVGIETTFGRLSVDTHTQEWTLLDKGGKKLTGGKQVAEEQRGNYTTVTMEMTAEKTERFYSSGATCVATLRPCASVFYTVPPRSPARSPPLPPDLASAQLSHVSATNTMLRRRIHPLVEWRLVVGAVRIAWQQVLFGGQPAHCRGAASNR